MSVAECISLISTVAAAAAAAAAAVFAAIELRRGLLDRRAQEEAHRNGVAVMWLPLVRPNHAEPSGDAAWTYEITVQNPGPLPIRDVAVRLTFATDVRRRHYDRSVDPPVRDLTMHQPVVLAQGTRVWTRTVVLPWEARDLLRRTTASISFTPVDKPRQVNSMDGRAPETDHT